MNEVIKIKPQDLNVRNEMHFEIQKRNRRQVIQSKKVYNRKKIKKNYEM